MHASGTTAPRRRVPRAEREVQMLEVAGQVFASRGFHGASMDEIAERVGISKPMLYAYFGSKDGLYAACIARAGEQLLAAVDEVRDARLSPEAQLMRSQMAFLRFVAAHRQGWAVLYRELGARGGPFATAVADVRAALTRRLVGFLTAACEAQGAPPRKDLEALAHAFIGAGESLANWWVDHPEESVEAMAGRLMDTGWLGLRQVVAGEAWPAGD